MSAKEDYASSKEQENTHSNSEFQSVKNHKKEKKKSKQPSEEKNEFNESTQQSQSNRNLGIIESQSSGNKNPMTITTEALNNPISNIEEEKPGPYVNNFTPSLSCIGKINRVFTPEIKKITSIVTLIIALILICLSILEVFTKFKVSNTIYIFISEVLIMFVIEIFSLIIVLSYKERREKLLLIICNIFIILFAFYQIFLFYHKHYNFLYRIGNICYCALMGLSSLISLIIIEKEMKIHKNDLQNIEEIINFTELNEEKNKTHNSISIIEYNPKKEDFKEMKEENKL